ncbi:DUF488 family protein [Gracilibacillus sp. YIM 98692]|uniref:DUF488 domain-containing protein n=1 Tax=Gracilibacillus sp. YIM 98692 TaxID=2663532 RepID=UPI0013D303FA|nr:DUF488 family protein [Gracilibacillus sp. YIM 98692]
MLLQLKRIYNKAEPTDGFRILVDRVWPRGVPKDKANLDLWLKEVGPSPALRKWFDHDPRKFSTFKEKYLEELENDPEKAAAYEELLDCYKQYNGKVTLIFATKELTYNHVVILKEKLLKEVQ